MIEFGDMEGKLLVLLPLLGESETERTIADEQGVVSDVRYWLNLSTDRVSNSVDQQLRKGNIVVRN